MRKGTEVGVESALSGIEREKSFNYKIPRKREGTGYLNSHLK
jgi:hypothetical protein